MTSALNQSDREFIWIVASEFFVDNEIDYDYEATRMAPYPLDDLKRIFFREVAPVCGPNVMTPAPVIWSGFDEHWLVPAIHAHLKLAARSPLHKVRYELGVMFYRAYFADVWKTVESALVRTRAKQAQGNP